MASAAEKYYIKDGLTKPAIHHQSYQKLWETKWKGPVCDANKNEGRKQTLTIGRNSAQWAYTHSCLAASTTLSQLRRRSSRSALVVPPLSVS
jgi:hypothetical protein